MRLTNPPTNEALLAALADHLAKHKYDLKSLMRTILQSETYQRSGKPLPKNKADDRFFSRYYPKRLKAEVMLDVVSQVTGSPTSFNGYPKGTRALQLKDSEVASYFLAAFGRPDRLITCECERSDEPSMKQVLHIMNGTTLNQKLAAKNNRVAQLLKAKTADYRIVEKHLPQRAVAISPQRGNAKDPGRVENRAPQRPTARRRRPVLGRTE